MIYHPCFLTEILLIVNGLSRRRAVRFPAISRTSSCNVTAACTVVANDAAAIAQEMGPRPVQRRVPKHVSHLFAVRLRFSDDWRSTKRLNTQADAFHSKAFRSKRTILSNRSYQEWCSQMNHQKILFPCKCGAVIDIIGAHLPCGTLIPLILCSS